MMSNRGSALFLFIALTGFLLSPIVNAVEDELIFGIYPYLSPSKIIEQYTPLNDHLSKALARPVILRSAPDFGKFIERTHAGEYDIIFTAPHMGRLAEKQDHYRPLAQSGYAIVIVVLSRINSPVKSLKDLQNRSLAVGAKLSMSYQITDQALGKNGLKLGKNVNFIDTASFSNVLEAVLRGEADAGATGSLLWDSAPAEQKTQLREIYRSSPHPGFFLLGHPRNGKKTLQTIEKALISFSETPAGQDFFARTRQIDFRPLDSATMKRIDPYTTVFDEP